MIPFARFAFFTIARDASFVTLAAATLMVGFSFVPPLAFKIGATVALIFSIVLLVRSYFLTEERLLRSEVWQALRPDERLPANTDGNWHGRSWKNFCCVSPRAPRGLPAFSMGQPWSCRRVARRRGFETFVTVRGADFC